MQAACSAELRCHWSPDVAIFLHAGKSQTGRTKEASAHRHEGKSGLPRQPRCFLGRQIRRCVKARDVRVGRTKDAAADRHERDGRLQRHLCFAVQRRRPQVQPRQAALAYYLRIARVLCTPLQLDVMWHKDDALSTTPAGRPWSTPALGTASACDLQLGVTGYPMMQHRRVQVPPQVAP